MSLWKRIFITASLLCFFGVGGQVHAQRSCDTLNNKNFDDGGPKSSIEVLEAIKRYDFEFDDQFDLSSAIKGAGLELCESIFDVELFRFGPIEAKNSTYYLVLERICTGAKKFDHRSKVSGNTASKVTLRCGFEKASTSMCLETRRNCKTYLRENFVTTYHVGTEEFEPILNFIDKFRGNNKVELAPRVLQKLATLEALKWIRESQDEPKILSIEFHDYTTRDAHSGRFQVVSIQGEKMWSAVLEPSDDGISLIHIGFLNR